jgi:cysteine synthase A
MITIGNTPLVRLNVLPEPGSAEVFVKWEGANPTGSMKDRMALSMIEGAEARGELRPGSRVVDYTGGSTGSSLAMVCAAKGYRAHFVSSDAFAEEKLQTMRAFGAVVELVPSVDRKVTPELIRAALRRVQELITEPDTFWTDQFNNPDNRAGYAPMAREILAALDGRLDEFVMGVGTGGCFSGNAEVYKQQVPQVRCIALEPEKSRALSGQGPLGGHRLEGMGAGFAPSICRLDLADEIMAVSDEDALATGRRLAREEGIFGGITSGANVWAALQRAKILGPGHRVVTVICDSGLKYLQGELFR